MLVILTTRAPRIAESRGRAMRLVPSPADEGLRRRRIVAVDVGKTAFFVLRSGRIHGNAQTAPLTANTLRLTA